VFRAHYDKKREDLVLVHKRTFQAILIIAALSISVAACSARSAAPASTASPTAVPATVAPAPAAPVPTQPATVAPAIDQSPLQPGTGLSPLQPGGAQAYVPLSATECETLRKSVADTLKADAQVETAGFRDYATGASGQGCMITVRGTGLVFPSVPEVVQQLRTLLAGQGWTIDQAYAADSPTGTLFGLRKDGQLALVDVGWIASAGVNCPKGQPISACNIKPEQQNYTITVNAGQGK
jgi:hypothetical protein